MYPDVLVLRSNRPSFLPLKRPSVCRHGKSKLLHKLQTRLVQEGTHQATIFGLPETLKLKAEFRLQNYSSFSTEEKEETEKILGRSSPGHAVK